MLEGRRTTWPSPVDSRTCWLGRKVPAWRWAMAGTAAVTLPMPIASAARAVPRRTRLRLVMLFILTGSHRNFSDTIAAGNADDGAGRNRCGSTCAGRRSGALRDAGALEARNLAAGCEGRVGVLRAIGDRKQQAALVGRVGAGRKLHLAAGDSALQLRRIVGD